MASYGHRVLKTFTANSVDEALSLIRLHHEEWITEVSSEPDHVVAWEIAMKWLWVSSKDLPFKWTLHKPRN